MLRFINEEFQIKSKNENKSDLDVTSNDIESDNKVN